MFDWQTNPANRADAWLTRVLSKAHYATLHFGLLAWPATLSCDRSGYSIALVESAWDSRNIAFGALLVVTVTIALLSIARKSTLALVSLCTCIVPFLPASGLFFDVGFTVRPIFFFKVMFSKNLTFFPGRGARYVHSIDGRVFTRGAPRAGGLSMGAASARLALLFLALAAIAALAARTWAQNPVWASEQTLYLSALQAYPSNAKAHFNYGTTLAGEADVHRKVHHFKEAIRLNPSYAAPYVNLGVVYAERRDFASALDAWERGLAVAKKNPIVSNDVRILENNLARLKRDMN